MGVTTIRTPMHRLDESPPHNACYAAKCDKCGKTTWKVSSTC